MYLCWNNWLNLHLDMNYIWINCKCHQYLDSKTVFICFLRGIKPSSVLVPNMWPLLGGHTRRNQTFPLGSSFCSHHGAVSRHMFMLLHHLGAFWVSHKWFTCSVFCNAVMGNNEIMKHTDMKHLELNWKLLCGTSH